MNITQFICALGVACASGCTNSPRPASPSCTQGPVMAPAVQMRTATGKIVASDNVDVEFPPVIVVGSPVQIRVAIRNISHEKQCLTIDTLKVVTQSLAFVPPEGSTGISIAGTLESEGTPDFGVVERAGKPVDPTACFVADRRIELEQGEQVKIAMTLSPFQQRPGHGEVAVVLAIPIFGSDCRCGRLNDRVKVEKRAQVEIVKSIQDPSIIPPGTKGKR